MSQQRRFLPSDPPLGPLDNREISEQEMEEAESTVNEYLQDPAAFDAAQLGGRSIATATINTLSFQQTDPTVSDNTSITHSTTQTLPDDSSQPSTNQPTSRVQRRVSFVVPAATQTRHRRPRVFVSTIIGWVRLTCRQEAGNSQGRYQCLGPGCHNHKGLGFISGFARREGVNAIGSSGTGKD
ncbi:hypothetical protein E4T42_04719 [Aureobasidium subglaciale]|nr:hypothetical protein E4T42_04719 [Aureobasidium subglaciale]